MVLQSLSPEKHSDILKALDNIIEDVDPKFDECLVEQFLENIRLNYCPCPMNHDKYQQNIKPLLDRILYFMKHDAFVMLNRPRIFQTFLQFSLEFFPSDNSFDFMKPYLEQLWSLIPTILINEDFISIGYILQILEKLLDIEQYSSWILGLKLKPSIAESLKDVEDVISLSKFVLEKTNNYHTKTKVICFMETLILSVIRFEIEDELGFQTKMRQVIHELIRKNNNSMLTICRELHRCVNDDDAEALEEVYEIKGVLQDTFEKLIDDNRQNLVALCKTIGSLGIDVNSRDLLLRLRQKRRFEEIMVFLSSQGYESEPYLATWMLAPIALSTCDIVDNKIQINEQVGQLMATYKINDSDEAFLVSNMANATFRSKIMKPCFIYVAELFVDETIHTLIHDYKSMSDFIALTIKTIQLFVNRNHHSNKNQYLHLALAAWERAMQYYTSGEEMDLDQSVLDSPLDTLKLINDVDSHRPTVFYLLRTMIESFRSLDRNEIQEMGELRAHFMRIVDLAFKFEDHEILYEFALFFITNPFKFPEYNRRQVRLYLKLVWDHMYLKGKTTTHREYLGCLAQLLLYIDLECSAPILEEFKLTRHHEIPKAIGDILIEYAPVVPTVARILECLAETSVSRTSENQPVTYVQYLDSPNLASSVKPNLDHLLLGISVAMHNELEEANLEMSIRLLCAASAEMLINYDDPRYLLTRLINTGILQTIYFCCTHKDYGSGFLYEKARGKIQSIRTAVVKQLQDPADLIRDLLQSIGQDQPQRVIFSESDIEPMIQFYTNDMELPRLPSCLGFSIQESVFKVNNFDELLDEILHFEDKHVSLDCY